MLPGVQHFLLQYHLLKSTLTINPKLNSVTTLTANVADISQLITLYRLNQQPQDLRQQCLGKRAHAAALYITSLRAMDEDIPIPQQEIKLVKPVVKQHRIASRGTPKVEKVERVDKEEKSEKRSCKQLCVETLEDRSMSSKQFDNLSQSLSSPIFTESIKSRAINISGDRDFNDRNNRFRNIHEPSEQSLSRSPDPEDHSQSQEDIQEEVIIPSVSTTPLFDKYTYQEQTQKSSIKEFSPEFLITEPAIEYIQEEPSGIGIFNFKVTSPEDDETHLHSGQRPTNLKPRLEVSPDLINIHQILKVRRSSNERQSHLCEFNSKVEEELRIIKEELKSIRNTQNDISSSPAQSRITTRTSYNPPAKPKETRVLRFDLSKSPSTPKPVRQLLTMSRAVSIKADPSRPSSNSRSRHQQEDKKLSMRLSTERKREQKSVTNLEKSMTLSKPRHRELLTTRIARFS